MSWQITAKISRRSRLCCLPALQTRVSVGILPVAGDREAPSAVAQPGVGSGVHGQRPGELERGDASQALPEQRTVRCPLAGITGRPEAAGHDVADHASPAGAVRAAPPGQEVIMRGSLDSAEPHRRAEDDAARRVSQRESGGHMALSERAGRAGVVLLSVEQCCRLGPAGRAVNMVMTAMLGVGLGGKSAYLLTTTGRKTRQKRTTPVILVETGGDRWLVSPYGTVGWVHNVRASPEVSLRRGKRTERLRAEEADSQTAGPVLQRYVRNVRVTAPFFDAKPDDPVEKFVEEAGRHPVFRLKEAAPAR